MIDTPEIALRLGLAAALGAVVGCERESKDWGAGLRDHMLVGLGSALFMLVSMHGFAGATGPPQTVLDPSGVASRVVSGIGFLCAGTILARGEFIRGLTTAASLWTVAAIGLAAGGGMYLAAIATAVLLLVILAVLKAVELRVFPQRRSVELSLQVDGDLLDLRRIEGAIAGCHADAREITVAQGGDPGLRRVVLGLKVDDPGPIVAALAALPGVRSVTHRRL